MCYDKSKSGPEDDQLVLLKTKQSSKLRDIVSDVQFRNAAKSDSKDNSEVETYPSNDMWGDQFGDQDTDMSDGVEPRPPSLKSDDDEPHDPFAE
eukprot:12236816-Karenia_brevis.AAC.1